MRGFELLLAGNFRELRETPGFFYAISYACALMISVFTSRRKISSFRTSLTLLLYLLTLTLGMIVSDYWKSIPVYILTELSVFFSMALVMYGLCELSSWEEAFYYAVRSFLLGEFAASLYWQIYYYALNSFALPDTFFMALFCMTVAYVFLFGIFFILEWRVSQGVHSLQITRGEAAEAFLIGIGFYFLSNLSYVSDSPFSSDFVGEIFIIRSLADFAGIALLESFHVQLIERKVRQENELLSKMLQMQYDNYRISEESVALVNQKYHDLKHQIRMLRNESNSRERTEYLDQMEQEIKRYEARFQTGNRILDTMLGAKSMQCMNEDIKMITVAEGQSLAFMNAMDISALFGNALDNAIESVRKISSPDRRLIHVTVSRQKNFLRIRVENCCDAKVDFKDGLPITTKGDRRYHGYGTKSIRSIVDKYGGSLTIESEDGWYRLRILFPLPATEGSL